MKAATQHTQSLDILRGLAALEVVLSHVRGFIFTDFQSLGHVNLMVKAFYYATGFGHQAVVIFFVLSGYFVGGSVLTSKRENFWSRYLINRLARLWVVLLPCLLATLVWNTLGRHTGGTDYLNGAIHPAVGSFPAGPISLDAFTFLGNLFFVQTIIVPVFGDNGPLWSLANEFWYYLLFPLLFLSWSGKPSQRVLFLSGVIVLLTLLFLLNHELVYGFAIWLLGALLFFLEKNRLDLFAFLQSKLSVFASLVTCLIFFHVSRTGKVPDLALGLCFAALFPAVALVPFSSTFLTAIVTKLADFSYTLYVTHFSLVAFIWCTWFGAQRLEPTPLSFGRFMVTMFIVLLYSYGMAQIGERNTNRVRDFATQCLGNRHRPLPEPRSSRAC